MRGPQNRRRIVVLASGNGSNLQALIDACARDAIQGDIVGVVSDRANAFALERAERAGIPVHVLSFAPFKAKGATRSEYDAALAGSVAEFMPDIVVLAGFMRLLSPAFLDRFPERIINLHPALPGQFIGKDAIERAWSAYEAGSITETGVMVHIVTEETDAGPVLGTTAVSLAGHDSLASLKEAMHAAEHFLLVQVTADLCAKA
jgi:phosphoribosylglycinamide formyltransferase 1